MPDPRVCVSFYEDLVLTEKDFASVINGSVVFDEELREGHDWLSAEVEVGINAEAGGWLFELEWNRPSSGFRLYKSASIPWDAGAGAIKTACEGARDSEGNLFLDEFAGILEAQFKVTEIPAGKLPHEHSRFLIRFEVRSTGFSLDIRVFSGVKIDLSGDILKIAEYFEIKYTVDLEWGCGEEEPQFGEGDAWVARTPSRVVRRVIQMEPAAPAAHP